MHPAPDGLLRPDDGDAYRQELRLLRDRSGLPVVFGGQVLDGNLTLAQFLGVRTSGLRGLRVTPGSGLGGRVLAAGRPMALNDYGSAGSITHDYDTPVLAEGIRAVTAVPVTVLGTVRGVLYAADRSPAPLGGRAHDLLADAARRLAAELSVRDEVDRRIRLSRTLPAAADGPLTPRVAEELRALHAELRSIAQDAADPALRTRLRSAARRLTALASPQDPPPLTPLSPRELDVLSQVALGCTNAEAAARLSLLPETVKAYLRSAMRKLDAHTRHEAVVSARRRGLLP
ncbi:helix-turn-helix transcriptional regulator [Actinocorallia populi]|uniref:helix-turn-helix transcriptional regulator n=1 Tax=Actinocorallia populi TaxID=2079200 RepID=UPI000D093210|nr:LuxR C-terminal-related transcriptional regulator [Actinocorallia populi]